jgi:(p)ppGpp synthase/HD superfamily hydrolase
MKSMTLESAISIASIAHRGQKDLGGKPYILHPLRVMAQMDSEEEMIAAVLHDLVEDTPWTIEGLRRANVPVFAVNAIDSLTRRKDQGETYANYILRVMSGNLIARKVKIADLRDNLDLNRLNPDDIHRYRSLIKREKKALNRLLTAPSIYSQLHYPQFPLFPTVWGIT